MNLRDLVSPRDVALAVALGVLAGVRATLPNALLGRAAASKRSRRASPGKSFFGSRLGANALTAAGLLELVGDKLPAVADRVSLSPQLARIGSGGVAAAALGRSRPGSMAVLALVGGASAALSTALSFRLRRRAIRRWGLSSASSGVLEDAVVLLAAAALMPQLRREAPLGAGADPARPVGLLG